MVPVAAAAVPPWKKFKERPIWLMPGGSSTTVEKAVGTDPYFFHTYAWAYYYHINNAKALKEAIGNKKRVAAELGISRTYLYKRLAEIDA